MGSAEDDLDASQTEQIPEENRSILLSLISQLGKSMDLYRVALPVFVLEPRSMLERISDFLAHPEVYTPLARLESEEERFLGVVKYLLSGWHIRPKGVKKPYNPVLGEFFRARYVYEDGSKGIYIAEQVCHHPPISAYYYASPDNGITMYGELHPKSRFLGNSAATLMQGYSRVTLTLPGSGETEVYEISSPNIYARGVLFGTMLLELGDKATVRGPSHECEVDFKVKGFFTGTYNAILGRVKQLSNGAATHEITGKWSHQMVIKDVRKRSNAPQPFFDATTAKIHPMMVEAEELQELGESRRKWSGVTAALHARDMDAATRAKDEVEQLQRQQNNERAAEGVDWQARFFQQERNGEWHFRHLSLASDPKEAFQQLEKFIFQSDEGLDLAHRRQSMQMAAAAVEDAVHPHQPPFS